MIRNGAVVDIYCQGEGTVNDANEVASSPIKKFPNVPGKLRALRGKELELARQIRETISHEFTCRQPGITGDMWLCEQGTGRLLNVEAAIPDERNIEFSVMCSERVQ